MNRGKLKRVFLRFDAVASGARITGQKQNLKAGDVAPYGSL
jgi:hypothetical protein